MIKVKVIENYDNFFIDQQRELTTGHCYIYIYIYLLCKVALNYMQLLTYLINLAFSQVCLKL